MTSITCTAHVAAYGAQRAEPRLIAIYEAEDRIPQLVETVKASFTKCNAENPGLEADWKKQVRRSL